AVNRVMDSRRGDGSIDYHQLDRPAVMRKQQAASHQAKPSEHANDMDYLDIPAFLRKQEEQVE
ncbi:MAG TPA: cell division protein FtsZ, partial [Legionellales bacterium]|nr:cell division protein FtsZ [Legionellales bacterium]